MSQVAAVVENPYFEKMVEAFGLRPVPRPVPCPRVVAGKRHRRGNLLGANGACVCTRHELRALDHGVLWVDSEDRYVVTSEPYWPYRSAALDADMAALASELDGLGLTAEVRPGEQWSPGATVLVWIQGTRPARRRDVVAATRYAKAFA